MPADPVGMKAIIKRVATESGIPEELHWVPLAIAYGESGYDPLATGDKGASIGLFQLHEEGVGANMGDSRFDPEINARKIMPIIASVLNRGVQGGLAGINLLKYIWFGAERPADTPDNHRHMEEAYRYIAGDDPAVSMEIAGTSTTRPRTKPPIEASALTGTPAPGEGNSPYLQPITINGKTIMYAMAVPKQALDTETGASYTIWEWSSTPVTPADIQSLTETGTFAPPPADPLEIARLEFEKYKALVSQGQISAQMALDRMRASVEQAQLAHQKWLDEQNLATSTALAVNQQRMDLAKYTQTERQAQQEYAQRQQELETRRGQVVAQDILPYLLPGNVNVPFLGELNLPEVNARQLVTAGLPDLLPYEPAPLPELLPIPTPTKPPPVPELTLPPLPETIPPPA